MTEQMTTRIYISEPKYHASRPPSYDAFLGSPDGEWLCHSHEPLLASARVLVGRGSLPPQERLEMWRRNSKEYDLSGTLGCLAPWTVSDNAKTGIIRYAKWKKFQEAAI